MKIILVHDNVRVSVCEREPDKIEAPDAYAPVEIVTREFSAGLTRDDAAILVRLLAHALAATGRNGSLRTLEAGHG